jgi:hypothetical protein
MGSGRSSTSDSSRWRSDSANGLATELQQILEELGLAEVVNVE